MKCLLNNCYKFVSFVLCGYSIREKQQILQADISIGPVYALPGRSAVRAKRLRHRTPAAVLQKNRLHARGVCFYGPHGVQPVFKM